MSNSGVLLQQVINGLSLGAMYALLALGFTLVYGILELINFAHFNVFMVSSFVGMWALKLLGISGQGQVTCGKQSVVSSPESIIMTSMTGHTRIIMSAECRHLTARICRKAVEYRIAEKLGRRLSEPLQFGMEVSSDSDFGRAWHQLLRHICQLSATAPKALAAKPFLGELASIIRTKCAADLDGIELL